MFNRSAEEKEIHFGFKRESREIEKKGTEKIAKEGGVKATGEEVLK